MKKLLTLQILFALVALQASAGAATLGLQGRVRVRAMIMLDAQASGPGHLKVLTNSDTPITIRLHERMQDELFDAPQRIQTIRLTDAGFLPIDSTELQKIEIIAP
jgi:hypothetical protein